MENSTNACLLCNQPLEKVDRSDSTRIRKSTSTEIQSADDTDNDEENASVSNLNGLIKQNRNADFKSILSRVNRPDLINTSGRNLIHTAAEKNNIEIIAFLVVSGFDIDAQNSLGQTPLHLALMNNNFQAAQLLLSLDADILLNDHLDISTLQMCFLEGSQVPEYINVCFLERLKRFELSAQQMADHLENVGCSIHQALPMNDAEVTSLMLDRGVSINADESRTLLERAVNANYPENVKALLNHGPGLHERRKIFVDQVATYRHEPKMKFYFKQLVSWDVITEDVIDLARYAFACENEDRIQEFLDIGIDDYVRKQFGRELLVSLFQNEKVDSIKIVENRQFEVNSCDENGYTALHYAVFAQNKAHVAYLLENGANPNIKDRYGQSPLFSCYNDETIEWLLEAGADVQALDNEGKSIIDENYSRRIIANLAILKERGLLKRDVEDKIRVRNSYVLKVFKRHIRDLQWMKTRKMSKSLFTALVDKVENTARYVITEDDVERILDESYKRELLPTYNVMLTKNLERALKLHELRPKAAAFLCDVMMINQRDHLVIKKIIGYLTYRDFLVFDKLNVEL